VGAVGTYSVNALRIVTFFVIQVNQGSEAAGIFNDSYGELLFIAWISLYIFLIVAIQRYALVEKTIGFIHRLRVSLSNMKGKPSSCPEEG
jgi:hypothetical protein